MSFRSWIFILLMRNQLKETFYTDKIFRFAFTIKVTNFYLLFFLVWLGYKGTVSTEWCITNSIQYVYFLVHIVNLYELQ